MPREKPLFRINLDRLDERFPDKEALKYDEIASFLGRSKRFVSKHYQQHYNKNLAGVSKTVLARELSQEILMPFDFNSVDVLCPFYIRDGKFDIICEGCLGDKNRTAKFVFNTTADKNFHKQNWCNKNYKFCEYYRALIEGKYQEG